MTATKITDKAMQATPGAKDTWLSESLGHGSGTFQGRITPGGERLLYFRYSGTRGRETLPIGPYAAKADGARAFTVAQGRAKAQALSALQRQNKDLRAYLDAQADLDRRETQKKAEALRLEAEAQQRRITVRQLFEQWKAYALTCRHDSNGKKYGRKDSGAEVARTLELHALPSLGNLHAEDVRRRDIMATLDPIRTSGKMRTTNIVLADLRQMFTFALTREVVTMDPTQGIDRNRDAGGQDVERDRFLTESELRDLTKQLPTANLNPRTEAAVWLMLATGVRIGELVGAAIVADGTDAGPLRRSAESVKAKFGTIDLDRGEWRIYGTKNGTDHLVHLSAFALKWLRKLEALRPVGRDDKPVPWLFPASQGEGPIAPPALNKQLQDRQRTAPPMKGRASKTGALALPGGKWTPHDLRRTFATTASRLGVSPEVIHLCLNHKPQNKLDRIYVRDTRMPARENAFNRIGDHLRSLSDGPATHGTIIQLRAA